MCKYFLYLCNCLWVTQCHVRILLKERIFFVYPQLSFFLKLGLCLFIYPQPLYLSPKLFFPTFGLCFLFLQGEKLVFNLCCSQGELSLFSIELNCFVFLYFSIFSYSLLRMFSVDLLIGLTLSIYDKKGEMKCGNMWESCLFCLRGDKIVFQRGRI